MRLKRFRVQNYRSVNDSGWIEIDDIAVIVGKNESGKTSVLKALWKFNPFKKQPYNLDREWPRGRRKEKSETAKVVVAEFEFDEKERGALHTIDESTQKITGVAISKDYKGTFYYSFLPAHPSTENDLKWAISILEERFGKAPETASSHFKAAYAAAVKEFIVKARSGGGATYIIAHAAKFKSSLTSLASAEESEKPIDADAIVELNAAIDSAVRELSLSPPSRRAIDMAHEWLPTFIYMDDYRIFRGSAQLDQVKQRRDSKQLTDEDETVVMLMEQAGLDLDDEVSKGTKPDREQRMLDMNDASQTLTKEIADRWSQKQYDVLFQADGHHLMTFVKDAEGQVLVPLEERSKGFQWFFSFDMTFMCETEGQFNNAVILLDEPGLHLHAAAQRDLLRRMAEYAKKNQLIYSTHLPFMIDFRRLDNIFVCEDRGVEGTIVNKDWATADKDARFTLQAALGLSWSQSLFVGQYNLIVEGVTDFWFLMTLSNLLREAGEVGLDEELVVTPAGGASKVAYIGTILHGQELNVMVLLDSDKEGEDAYKQLVHQWILDDTKVLMLGQVLNIPHHCALEDLFEESYYLEHVRAAYAKELGKKTLKLPPGEKSIVERVEAALSTAGVQPFNKGRVAKRIMSDLASKKLADLPPDTVSRFRGAIAAVNQVVAKWRAV